MTQRNFGWGIATLFALALVSCGKKDNNPPAAQPNPTGTNVTNPTTPPPPSTTGYTNTVEDANRKLLKRAEPLDALVRALEKEGFRKGTYSFTLVTLKAQPGKKFVQVCGEAPRVVNNQSFLCDPAKVSTNLELVGSSLRLDNVVVGSALDFVSYALVTDLGVLTEETYDNTVLTHAGNTFGANSVKAADVHTRFDRQRIRRNNTELRAHWAAGPHRDAFWHRLQTFHTAVNNNIRRAGQLYTWVVWARPLLVNNYEANVLLNTIEQHWSELVEIQLSLRHLEHNQTARLDQLEARVREIARRLDLVSSASELERLFPSRLLPWNWSGWTGSWL